MSKSFFVHPNGIVENGARIGDRTRIWAFVHILPGAQIGSDCNICDHVFIESDVKVGDRVTIKCGVQLWDGILLADDVFIGPNVAFSNDPFPRSKQHPQTYSRTIIQNGVSIGSNATILPGITIGQGAMIGAGTVVTNDVPANAIVVGNPGRVIGFVNEKSRLAPINALTKSIVPQIGNAKIVTLKNIQEDRGSLSFGEFGNHLPFVPQRYFVISQVPLNQIRGLHAHRKQQQFLICVSGSCHVVIDDGIKRAEIILSSPEVGLHIPPLIWGIQYKYSSNAILLVFASGNYDSTDYINDYQEFLSQST